MKAIGYVRTTLVLGATMAAGLLTLTALEPAGAAFPGSNGKIAFTSTRDGNVEIYTMNADGSSQTRLTNATGNDLSPAFSSDGARIAFESSRPSSNPSDPSIDREIYTMNADGTNQTKLTSNLGTDAEPTFSPDGTKIAFTSDQEATDGTTDREIWIMNADGKGALVNLTNAPRSDEAPAWSPDGTKIAFRSDRVFNGSDDYDIWVMNADGSGTPTNLTNAFGGDDSSPSWSPDGTKITFERGGSFSGAEIFVTNTDGSGSTPVTDATPQDGDQNPGDQLRPSFSPDGRKVAFFDSLSGDIVAMNADGSGTPAVLGGPGTNDQPDWAPLNFDLSLVQSDLPDPVKVNNDLTYAVEVTNEGFDDAPGVVLTDRLPAGVTFVSASTGCAHAFGRVTCNLGTVAKGSTVTKTVVVKPTAADIVTNTTSVDSTADEITFTGNNSDRERTEVALNRAPVADDDSYVTGEDTPLVVPAPGVLADDADADGDPLVARVVETTGAGALTSARDGSFRYEPDTNSNGADAFTYDATDGTARSNVATVTIVVRAVNDPPEAEDETVQAAQDTPLDVDVLANDRDPDRDDLDVTSASDPAHGAATLGANDTVRYVPDARHTGPDSFTYTVSDPGGATDTATVNVTVSDTKAPTVVKALPIGRNVLPTANVTALFSEPMAAGTLFEAATGESATFVLKKGTVKVPATVSYNPGTLTATLDPDAKLRRGATYTATVTTGAEDEAGTPLDQDPNTAGNQGKVWSFKIKP